MTSTAASGGQLKVWHESLWSAREDPASAVSQDGMTIVTAKPLPKGTRVFLEFPPEADGHRVGVDAVVTHSGGGRMSVRFDGLDAQGRAVVAAWVQRLPEDGTGLRLPDGLDLPLTPPPVTPAPDAVEQSLVATVLAPQPKTQPAQVAPPPALASPAGVDLDDLLTPDAAPSALDQTTDLGLPPLTPALSAARPGVEQSQDLSVDLTPDAPVPTQDTPLPPVEAADPLAGLLSADALDERPLEPVEPAFPDRDPSAEVSVELLPPLEDVPATPAGGGPAPIPVDQPALVGAAAVPADADPFDTLGLDAAAAPPPLAQVEEPAVPPQAAQPAPAPMPWEDDGGPTGPFSLADAQRTPVPAEAPPPPSTGLPAPPMMARPGVEDLFDGVASDPMAPAPVAAPAPLEDVMPEVVAPSTPGPASLSDLLEPAPPPAAHESLPPLPPVEAPVVPATPPPVGAPASFEPALQAVTMDAAAAAQAQDGATPTEETLPPMTAAASMFPQAAPAVVAPVPAAADFGRPSTAAGVYRAVQDNVEVPTAESVEIPGVPGPPSDMVEIAPGSDVLPDLELDANSGEAFFETNWTDDGPGAPAAPVPAAQPVAHPADDHNAPVTRDPLFDAWGQPVMVPQLAEDSSLPAPAAPAPAAAAGPSTGPSPFPPMDDGPPPDAPLLDAPALGDLPPVEALAFQGFGDATAQVEIPAGVQSFAWAVQNGREAQKAADADRPSPDSPDFDPVFDLAPSDAPAAAPPPRPAMPAVLAGPASAPAPMAAPPPPVAPAPAPVAPAAVVAAPAPAPAPAAVAPVLLDLGAPSRHPTPAPSRLRAAATPPPPKAPAVKAPAAAEPAAVPAFGKPRSESLLSMDAPPRPGSAPRLAPVPGSSPRLPPIPAAAPAPAVAAPLPPAPMAAPPAPPAQVYDASFDAALEQGFPVVAEPPLGPPPGPPPRSSNPAMPVLPPVAAPMAAGRAPGVTSGSALPTFPLPQQAAPIFGQTGASTGSRPLPAVLALGTPAGGLPTVPPTQPAAPGPVMPPMPAPALAPQHTGGTTGETAVPQQLRGPQQDPFAFERAVEADSGSRQALMTSGPAFFGDSNSGPGVDLTGAGTTAMLGAPRPRQPSQEPPLARPDPMVAQAALGDLDLSGNPGDAPPLASGSEMVMSHPENRFGGAPSSGRSPTEEALPAVGGVLLDAAPPAASPFGRPATAGMPPGPFGAPQSQPAFGTPQSSAAFGPPQAQPAFGAPGSSAFGAPQSGPGFGTPQSSAFGQPQAPAFGTPPSGPFGPPQAGGFPHQQQPVFAGPPGAPATFGRPTTGEPLMPGFGRPRTNVDPHAQPPGPPPGGDEPPPLVVQGQLLPPAGAPVPPPGAPPVPAARWQPQNPMNAVPPTQPAASTGPNPPNLSAEIDRLFDED